MKKHKSEWTGIPSDLPQVCPKCGKEFSVRTNFSSIEHPLACQLRRVGKILIFAGPIVFFGLIFAGADGMTHLGTGSGFTVLLLMVGPGAMVLLVANGFARWRRLRCFACGWEMKCQYPKEVK
ncbi:MAG: hypothetical protein AAF591_08800 [Verrucomicrobiota bacterium]